MFSLIENFTLPITVNSAKKIVISRNRIRAAAENVKCGSERRVMESDNNTAEMLSRMCAFVSAIWLKLTRFMRV